MFHPAWKAWAIVLPIAIVLLTAGILKALDWQSTTSGQMSITFRLTLVSGEWFMAVWLLSGLLPRLAWTTTLALFATFLLASSWKFLHGSPSCGCFGSIPVPPFYTVLLDAAAITALLFFRPPNTLAAESPRLLQRKTLLSLLLALLLSPLLAWSVIFLATPRASQATAGLPQSGNTLILEPDQWLTKPFPLFTYLDNPSPLSRGRWLVLLVHTDCPDCQAAMARYRTAAAQPPLNPLTQPLSSKLETKNSKLITQSPALIPQSSTPAPRSIAFLVVPSTPHDPPLPPSPGITLLQLPTTHEWFASTPTALLLTDSIVTQVFPPAQAADPALILRN